MLNSLQTENQACNKLWWGWEEGQSVNTELQKKNNKNPEDRRMLFYDADIVFLKEKKNERPDVNNPNIYNAGSSQSILIVLDLFDSFRARA